MKGVIVNFRGSFKTKIGNQMVIIINNISSVDKAKTLVGKTVVWTSPGKAKKQIKGKITSTHGGNGAVRVLFETGMPGQSIGQEVDINA